MSARMIRCALATGALLAALPPHGLTAQAPVAQTPPDTLRRVSPASALWRSLVLPGWGQAVNDRHVAGAVFVIWEGVSAMMTLKAQGEVRYYREIGSPLLDSKRQEVQDWLVLWVFNHLFAGAEAYVSTHLRDFPPDLRLRAFPGGVAVSLSLPALGVSRGP